MSDTFALDGLDLAALVASRVCHDLISPVAAIVNGFELLDEAKQDEAALDLIRKSAQQASARLEFCRLAFGAAGSIGAELDTGDAERMARGMFESERTKLSWNLPRQLLPKNRVKLLLNLLLIASNAVPRGGTLTAEATADGFMVLAKGTLAIVPANGAELLAGRPPEGRVDATCIQPFYTGLLARASGLKVAIAAEPGEVRLTASAA